MPDWMSQERKDLIRSLGAKVRLVSKEEGGFLGSIRLSEEYDDGDSILMAQKLAAEIGVAVGISSGANFLGALTIQNKLERDAVVVTILSDDNKKYLSTDLLREEPVKDGFLSPRVRLHGFRAFKRVCQTCCDPATCRADHPEGIPVEKLAMASCPWRYPGKSL